ANRGWSSDGCSCDLLGDGVVEIRGRGSRRGGGDVELRRPFLGELHGRGGGLAALRIATQLELRVIVDVASLDVLDGLGRVEHGASLFDAIEVVVGAFGAEAHIFDDVHRVIRLYEGTERRSDVICTIVYNT